MQAPITFTYEQIAIHAHPLFQVAVLAMLLLFMLWLVTLKGLDLSIGSMIHISSPTDLHKYASKASHVKDNRKIMQMWLFVIWSALLSLSIMRIIYSNTWSGERGLISEYPVWMVGVAIFTLPIIFAIYQWVVVTLLGVVSRDFKFRKRVMQTYLSSSSLGVIVSTPIFLLMVLYDKFTSSTLIYVVVISFAITLINDIFHSLRLFITEKLSILDWILYICTVKLVPLTFLWRVLMIE